MNNFLKIFKKKGGAQTPDLSSATPEPKSEPKSAKKSGPPSGFMTAVGFTVFIVFISISQIIETMVTKKILLDNPINTPNEDVNTANKLNRKKKNLKNYQEY